MAHKNYRQTAVLFFTSRTGHLTLTYLSIIMFMSIAGSAVFYETASNQLERQLPPPAFYDRGSNVEEPREREPVHRVDFDDFFEQRIDESHDELLERLIQINILALVIGSLVSYALARRLLRPTEVIIATQRRLLEQTGQFPELHELSDLAGKTLVLKAIHLSEIVDDAHKHTKSITKKHIELKNTVGDMKVLGDKPTLTRLIEILLDNAVRYSAAGTSVHISADTKSDRAYLHIRDEGTGIGRADLPHIFTEFYQADRDHALQEREGNGIGLTLAYKLAEKNDGKLRIKSVVDQGTIVIIELKQP